MKTKDTALALKTISVWKQLTPELKQELLDFWKSNKAIGDEEKAARRADQAVCISRDKDGAIGAVATAIVRVLPRLRQPMYYYRHFFSEPMRGQKLTKPFVKEAKKILQEYNASLPKPEALGLLVELESKLLDEHYKRAFDPDTGFTFIGYSPRQMQLRVSYFEEVRLLPPAPLPRRAEAGVGDGARAGARNH